MPQPTALKLMRGNPGKRALNEAEPKPETGRPAKPQNVADNPIASAQWDALCVIVEKMRVLTVADGEALGNLCYDIAVLHEAQEGLNKSGVLTMDRFGQEIPNPLLKVIQEASTRVARGLREFGLTPSSRSTIKVDRGQEKTGWANFG